MSSPAPQTLLHENPFQLLGVSPRDNRQRIVEKAETRGLEVDHERCQQARAQIVNPRTRLAAEVSWLPGVSPSRASQIVRRIAEEPQVVRGETGLPGLARANALVAAVESAGLCRDVDAEAVTIREIAVLVDRLDLEEIRRDINEDRAVAGFPALASVEQLEEAVGAHKRRIREVIHDALDRLPTSELIAVMTRAAEASTDGGEYHAPELMDALIEAYATEAHAFLETEATNVDKLIGVAREVAAHDGIALSRMVDAIERVTRNWDRVAQPIQLSLKARGLEHEESVRVAVAIRSLSVDLVNQHQRLDESSRLTRLLQEVFAEVPEVVERVDADAHTLAEMADDREEWLREISYQAEVGILSKRTLQISEEGVSWASKRYPLKSISRVRWGAMRHSYNGIPTGTTYTIGFGDKADESVVTLRTQKVYSEFVDRLWRAVGPQLAVQTLKRLESGEQLRFGDAVVADDFVILKRHKLLGQKESVKCRWRDVHVWSADGAFIVGAQKDAKVYAQMSYIDVANAVVLEFVITRKFKVAGDLLSDLLRSE